MHYNSQDYSLKAMTNFLAVFSKVTVVPVHTMKACREAETLLYSFYILTLGSLISFMPRPLPSQEITTMQ
jgi:hypothetical protein